MIQLFVLLPQKLFTEGFQCDLDYILKDKRLLKRWAPINRMIRLQLIKWAKKMIDNSDIPLPADELKSRVLVFAITDEASHQYEEITKGYVELSTDEDDKNHTFHYLEVKDQLTNEVLMRSNLRLQNNFGKQKGSIISWTDEQQPQYQEIALSFQKDKECDMFWRTICEKIGKSYLQINGVQKLQTPNVNNLNYFLEKAKNSIDLMDYNIVHSKSIMQGLRQVFYQMKGNNDQFGMGTVLRIINAIMCPSYSSTAIQTLLSGQNFYLTLDLQQFRRGICFQEIYEKKVGQYLKNKFNLPADIFQKIELSHRATFYRQNVLDLAEQSILESMMFMICKEAQVEIMSYLNRVKFFECLINYTQYPNSNYQRQEKTQQKNSAILDSQNITNDKVHFIHEALIMYNQITSEQIKITFKQNIYSSGVLKFIKEIIQKHNLKALQILFCINEIDKQKFFQFLIEDFKTNSSDNMLKTLMKKYVSQISFRFSIIALIESMAPLFNLKRQFFDFFNGTFICSVFSVAKDSRSVLLLANVLLAQLQNSSVLFPQFIKLKICEKMASEYRSGTSLKSKAEELQILKFLKYVIVEQSHKGPSKNKEIEKNIIDSGFFDCCMMIYFKHSSRNNVLSSSMLQNLKLIQRMDYSQFDSYIVKEYSTIESLQKIVRPIRAKHIEQMNRKTKQSNDQDYLQVQRIVHEEILQNQQQDSYLMNDDHDNLTSSSLTKDFENGNIKNQQFLPESRKEAKKQDQLMFLKRMMDEMKQDEDEAIQKQPRKIVKKNQDSKQTAIQFCFDLPDIDLIQQQELSGT